MRHFIPVFLLFISVFGSCSTDVDLYADYKDVAIIYAMLDHRADTNYVKIIRAFCGTNDDPIDASEVALIADSSNYPGKLDARIIEWHDSDGHCEPTGRVFILDTLTLHNKVEGAFYSPDQKVYYTTGRFNTGSGGDNYEYRFVMVKPDGDTVTAQTCMVGNEEFSIISGGVQFQMESSNATGRILFRADGAAPIYDLKMQFNYLEQHNGQEKKLKSITRNFGVKPLYEFMKLDNLSNVYYQEYSVNWLFNTLKDAIGNDTVVNFNHPNVVRYVDSFVVSISAGGNELYNYYMVNDAVLNSLNSFVTTYTNVIGGYGLFSSRTTIKKEVRLSAYTLRDLFGKSSWGFVEH